ncbi:MAG: hypothetical protein ABSC29_01000 [Minisyncoccia bacterium]|jgi:glycerophosphoryl diester phosphodiesterase
MDKMPLITAHRGGKFWEGDDFSYISESIRDGADIIELDVRLCDGKYIVQHAPYEKAQGFLEDAFARTENTALYLDIKSRDIKINELIAYVHSFCSSHIIVGSYHLDLLRSIQDLAVERNCHCVLPWTAVPRGRSAHAGWVNPLCYFTTKSLAQEIRDAGFKFVPSGNQIFKKHEIMENQLRYARWGAYAISTHHVKEMKELLQQIND